MIRLPVIGSDDDMWGQLLNDFLGVEHNADGTLKDAVRTADSRLNDQRTPLDASITDAKIASTLSPSKITGTALIRSNNLADLASSSVARTNLGLNLPLNPLNFGAVGDGSTLDDAAFAAMFAQLPAVGGHIYLPVGYNFKLSQSLTLNSGLRIEGGDKRSAKITNVVSDVFTVNAVRQEVHLHDFSVIAGANDGSTGGHIFNFGANGVNLSRLNSLYLQQNCPTKSILIGAQYLDNSFADCNLASTNSRSVPAIKLVSTTGNLSDNVFHDFRHTDYGTPTTWVIWLEEFSGTTAIGNVLERINFENPAGGAIVLRGQNSAALRQIWLWDLASTATNHLILLDKTAGGQGNVGVTIEGVSRPSGSLGTGLRDIASGGPGYGVGTTVRRCATNGSQALLIDLAYDVDQNIEDCYGAFGMARSWAPDVTVAASAGSGASVSGTGNFYEGTITLNTGTGTSAGAIVNMVFPNGVRNTPAAVILTPMSTTVVAAGLYVSSITTGGCVVSCASALPASTANLQFCIAIYRSSIG